MSARGPVYVVTEEWREAARRALAAQPRGTQERLAREIGCTPGAISRLLAGDHRWSELVGDLSAKLGVVVPHAAIDDERLAALIELGRALSKDDLDHLVWLAERLVAGREREREGEEREGAVKSHTASEVADTTEAESRDRDGPGEDGGNDGG